MRAERVDHLSDRSGVFNQELGLDLVPRLFIRQHKDTRILRGCDVICLR